MLISIIESSAADIKIKVYTSFKFRVVAKTFSRSILPVINKKNSIFFF